MCGGNRHGAPPPSRLDDLGVSFRMVEPRRKKGEKILTEMKEQYGAKKGKEVFYKMERSGKLTSVKKK